MFIVHITHLQYPSLIIAAIQIYYKKKLLVC